MIVANLATYPPRLSGLLHVIRRMAPQVDRLNVVLNEYSEVPVELRAVPNVVPILPEDNTMDVGKFYPPVAADDVVFLIDDDLHYPSDYVSKTLERFENLGEGRWLGGYHGSTYARPRLRLHMRAIRKYLRYSPERIADYRKVLSFNDRCRSAEVVDQIASNAAILMGRDLPPFKYMRGSQRFVDVRLARWCHEQGISSVVLPRAEAWLTGEEFEETIYRSFTTQNPPHVAEEIWSYAFKVPGSGRSPAVIRRMRQDRKIE